MSLDPILRDSKSHGGGNYRSFPDTQADLEVGNASRSSSAAAAVNSSPSWTQSMQPLRHMIGSSNLSRAGSVISITSQNQHPQHHQQQRTRTQVEASAVRIASRLMSRMPTMQSAPSTPIKAEVKQQYFCMICRNNNSLEEDAFTLTNCGHTFCRECFKQFLSLKVNDGKVHPRCFFNPQVLDRKGTQCNAPVSPDDVRSLLDPHHIQKYERFLRRDRNSHMRDCPRCQHDQAGDPLSPWMTCVRCDHQFCYEHANAHTKDEACSDYEARIAKDMAYKLSDSVVQRISKKCPGCGSNIQKLSGCNHMTCSVCGCGFCWLCLEEIGNSTMPEHFNPKGSNPCAGRQFEAGEQAQLPLRLWEVHICVLLPMLLVLLLVPLVFLLIASLSLVFCLSLCFLAICGRECWEAVFRIAVVTLSFPVLLISSPFWLPCVLYIQCVVARRNRAPEEGEDEGLEEGYQLGYQQEQHLGTPGIVV